MGPDFVRSNLFKTLPKLIQEEKYAADVYRLGHLSVVDISIDYIMKEHNVQIPENLICACQMLAGGCKSGKLVVVQHICSRNDFLLRLFQYLGMADANFGAIRSILSSILITTSQNPT